MSKPPKRSRKTTAPVQPVRDPKAITWNHSGFIILRLAAGLPRVQAANLIDAARELKLLELLRTLQAYKLVQSNRLIQSLSCDEMIDLETQAAKSKRSPRHSLTSYWRIDARTQQRDLGAIVDRLNSLKDVALAYPELAAGTPAPPSDPRLSEQRYLLPAKAGIGAFWAWAKPDALGAGVTVVDVETGWYRSHEDLPSSRFKLLCGQNHNMESERNHGTAVLGILAAQHNNKGIAGLAPQVDRVGLASHYRSIDHAPGHVADALAAALPRTTGGDIILLEVERNQPLYGLPTETDPADWQAIRLAVDLGRTVIEAAGNGGLDLDHTISPSWPVAFNSLNPADASFADSGAIMVGASSGVTPHRRHPDSNYGSRIDCFAWGDNVLTCKWTTNGSTYANFTHTSAAAAIVAGAALLVQSHRIASGAAFYSPAELRQLLPTNGTGSVDPIGKMPNLQKIVP